MTTSAGSVITLLFIAASEAYKLTAGNFEKCRELMVFAALSS